MFVEPTTEDELLERGLERLRAFLGDEWRVEMENPSPAPGALMQSEPDRLMQIVSPDNTHGRLLIEVALNPQPSRLRATLLPRLQLMRRLQGYATALVIAPWIGPQTADLLDTWDCSYLDLTGNVSLRLRSPGLIVRLTGDTRDPRPRSQQRGLSGPRAGSLVRVLADVCPPYRGLELAQAAGLSQSYVSRLLDSLDEQGLIRKRGRQVEDVDWEALLRTRAEQAPLMSINETAGFVAPNGVDDFVSSLKALSNADLMDGFAVTGAFAAAVVAPLTVGGQLMLYTTHSFRQIARRYGLLPVDQAPDLILLSSKDPVPFRGTGLVNGLPHVAPSQLALDLLSGPGRLPAAGEALLDTMRGPNERAWRLENLNRLTPLRS